MHNTVIKQPMINIDLNLKYSLQNMFSYLMTYPNGNQSVLTSKRNGRKAKGVEQDNCRK